MNLQPNKTPNVEINLTPLIDVVFLMLIFFMVSTTFDRETRIKVQLPEASATEQTKEEKIVPVLITIDSQGRFYVNKKELVNTEFATLRRTLQKAVKGVSPLPPVIITADAKTPHQSVMTAMDAASQVGLYNMTFSAKQRTDK